VVTGLPNFYKILRFCTRLQVDFKFLLWLLSGYKQPSYKHFPVVGAFSLKFSIASSGETTDRIRKRYGGCKNGTDLLYHHAKYGGDRGSRTGSTQKSGMFFVCLSRFGITKFVITETETLWSSVIFKTIMVPLHRGRILVVHLYSSFCMDPLDFFLGQIYTKYCYFWRFWQHCAY